MNSKIMIITSIENYFDNTYNTCYTAKRSQNR